MAIVPRLRDRPTPDLIVIGLTIIVGVILLVTTATLVISEILYPDRELAQLGDRIATITSSLIAAIVGYLAGRGVTNGNSH